MFDPEFFPKVGIYKIENPAGRVYIGQSTDLEKRFANYKCLHCKKQHLVHNSLIKYGYEAHKIEILVICKVEELNDLERHYISLYKSNNREYGLNLTSGGKDYFFHSEDVKVRMSLAQMGNKKSLGRKQTKEEIQKRVAKLKGKKRTPEFCERMRQKLTGKKTPQTVREKLKANSNPVCKQVKDKSTGIIYKSCGEAAKAVGMKKTTLTAMLNGQNPNKTTLIYNN